MAKFQDVQAPYLTLAEGAAPATPASGLGLAYEKTDGKLYFKNDAGTEYDLTASGSGGPSINTYTPVLTATSSNPTLGTGSIAQGRYTDDGYRLRGDILIKFGTSGVAAGSGSYRISHPAAREEAAGNYLGYMRGAGFLYDSSAGAYRSVLLSRISSTTVELALNDALPITPVTHAAPWAWAAGDAIVVSFDFEKP